MIEECLAGVRGYFPDAEILVMADGVRPAVEHRRAAYNEYLNRLMQKVNTFKFGRTELVVFNDWHQQALMTKQVLQDVKTPLIMFMEHDAVFRHNPPVDFNAIFSLLLAEGANLVRFYNWADVWHEHAYLMRGEFTHQGARFVKTVQYSQWPLVSRTDYHRRILDRYFKPGQRSMIESGMYGPVAGSRWEEHKIVIYFNGGLVFEHKDGRTDPATGKRDPAEW